MLTIIFVSLLICYFVYLFNREITTEEFIGCCAIAVASSLIAYGLTIIPYPNDIYYQSGKYNKVEYHPYFKEKYQQPHTVCTSTGKTTTCHTYYTTEYHKHPERYKVFDSLGQVSYLNRSQYLQIAKEFGDKTNVLKGRRFLHGGRCVEGDSNLYYVDNLTNIYKYPTTQISTWHNPLKRKISLFNTEKEQILQYPEQYNWRSNNRLQGKYEFSKHDLDVLNTKLYEQLGVNVNIIQIDSVDKANQIKYSWNSGKKNDINIFIAEDGIVVFGWYKHEILTQNLQTALLSGINLDEIHKIILSDYEEFDFKQFNYLKQPELWQLLITAFVTLCSVITALYLFSQNEYYRDQKGNTHWNYRRY